VRLLLTPAGPNATPTTVSVITQWSRSQVKAARGKWETPILNTAAVALLEANPQASRAMLVLSDAGAPFLLLEFGQQWRDVKGAIVHVSEIGADAPPPPPAPPDLA
jgi:hypothetical protein